MVFKDRRLLFFDDRDIELREGVNLVLNPPEKRGPCLYIEKEWELGGTRPMCIVRIGDEYRLYYSVRLGEGETTLAFAISKDGITWERPELGVREYKGSKANNLVSIDGCRQNEGCIFVDPSAPKDQRIKLVGHAQEEGGMYVMTSPDGFSFKRNPGNLLPFILDNHNSSFYDSRIGKYVIYSRGWDRDRPIPPMEGSRTVIRIETDDLLSPVKWDENAPDPWPMSKKWEGLGHENMRRVNKELPSVISPDEMDPPEADIYQAAAVQYLADAYLAFPSLYYHHPWYPEGFINDGYLDLQFAASRDGINWRRDFRGSYVRLDLPDGPCTKMMHMLVGMVPYEFRISQYYIGSRRSHGEGRVPDDVQPKPSVATKRPPQIGDAMVYRAEQRLDGFVSADSAYTGGMLITKPFVLESPVLKINVDTSASGVAHAALLWDDGSIIEGHSLEDSDRIQGNDTDWVLSWRKKSDLSHLVGKKIKLMVRSRSTKLFAVYPCERSLADE